MSKRKHKKEQQRRPRASSKAPAAMSQVLYEGLREADRLRQARRLDQARDLLEDLERRYPRRTEVLHMLLDVQRGLGNIRGYVSVCRRLLLLQPDDTELLLALASSYLVDYRPGLAVQTYRRVLERDPMGPHTEDARRALASLEKSVNELMSPYGDPGEDRLELAAVHDEIRYLLDEGRYDRVCEVAEKLLKKHPEFLPALNNMGQAYLQQGRLDQAMAAAREVLRQAPENYHAMANLIRYLCLSGEVEEAKTWAEKLKAVRSSDPDIWIKKAEALSFLGDDQGVLDVLEQAEKGPERPEMAAFFYHLGAVAAWRTGQEKTARGHWKKALHIDPGLGLAHGNLDDLKRPEGERHAPWAYTINYWIPEALFHQLTSRLRRAERRGKDREVKREARLFLEEHPQIAKALPLLLDRGDAAGREFAHGLIMLVETRDLMGAFADFALSQRGPDALRQQAAQAAREAGFLPAGPIRIWLKGEWHDVMMLGFEISDEPRQAHAGAVGELAYEALQAVREGDGKEAEALLLRALEAKPDAVDLRYNLSIALRVQGRLDEADRLVDEVVARDPDYFFGRIALAHRHIENDEFEEAKEALRPLMERQKLHTTEFASLCDVQIELLLAQDQIEGARMWLEMLEKVHPDTASIAFWQRTLSKRGRNRGLGRLASRR